ncbi:MAG: hypothetical protein COA96_17090 [SAR86 cluster bacterium]|uniref:DUF2190 domain-containing protein n=1 Tax=SAR86 cluster bacterium TaxID=2030880 RepID=A0A2A5AGB8_9GAMM|nr:MAG: hypothetical protein COA96_17090 [SAR86 cluster bacterium]
MQFVQTSNKSLTNGAAVVNQYERVKLVAGVLVVAGAVDREIGVMHARGEIGAVSTVILRTSVGTTPMIANAAIASGAVVYGAADGKISPTQAAGAAVIGKALEAASGDGSLIEVLRDAHDNAT